MTVQTVTLEALTTEDGDPWGVYAYGHIDPKLVTLPAINDALRGIDCKSVKKAKVRHLWMHMHPDYSEDDFPWHWCEATTKDAIAVTGVRFGGQP